MKRIFVAIIFLLMAGLAQGQADLLLLARTGTVDEVRDAIEAGADVTVTDQHGQNSLIYALHNPNPEVLTILLETGADVNRLTNSLWTPLMYAARDTSRPEVILRLLEFNPAVSLRNPQGFTSLLYASQNPSLRGSEALRHLFNRHMTEMPTTGVLPQQSQALRALQARISCIDINTAGQVELERIIHIGPERAQQIISLRPFRSINDLTRVNGIAAERLQDIQRQGLACVR